MALSSVFVRLLILIASVEASNSVVRRVNVEAASLVRVSSAELEAKRTDLLVSDMHEASTAARRDVLWQVVRKVDDQLQQKPICKLDEGSTYAKKTTFVAGYTSYSKLNVASARECALMCAADSLDDRNHKNLACKSFTYNKTAQECNLFNFGKQEGVAWSNDACCTSGPPCNLDSMRKEIQSYFHAELERVALSQKDLASNLKTASKHLASATKQTQQSSPAVREAKQSKPAQKAKLVPLQKAKETVAVVPKGVVVSRSTTNVNKKTTHAAELKTRPSQWPNVPMSPVMAQPPVAPAYTTAPGVYAAPYAAPSYAAPYANVAPTYTVPAYTPASFPAPAYTPPTYAMPAPQRPVAPVPQPVAIKPTIPAAPVAQAPPKVGHNVHGFFALSLATLFYISVLFFAAAGVVSMCGKRRGGA
jgi:hypothetical protein